MQEVSIKNPVTMGGKDFYRCQVSVRASLNKKQPARRQVVSIMILTCFRTRVVMLMNIVIKVMVRFFHNHFIKKQ